MKETKKFNKQLNEEECKELREKLLFEMEEMDEYIHQIDEVYSHIGDQTYDIISLLDKDKTIKNWIDYGYSVGFKTQ